ncbi:E3 SUMO-protein ligase PIAS4-A-like [Aphis gossypii]|uniref:E3 SUMO-protein ligase PIAS4-A-like n=1 Tax=Aphis gossypii TaxID=80765 RepID=UPI0021591FD8|nr:E3 SUMO-protein ligase PIAS4-A-like [Aphis gossypii]
MVYAFNSDELRNILGSLPNQVIFSNEESLRNHLLYLLTSSSSSERNFIEKKILEVYKSRSVQLQHQPPICRPPRPQIPYFIQPTHKIPDETIHFAHNLPFFKTLETILPPLYSELNADSFNFVGYYYLSESTRNSVIESWNNYRKEYKLKIILRIEQFGEKLLIERLPYNIYVSVNGRQCRLPELNISTVGTPWRHNVPIDITEYTDLRTCLQNTLNITWSNEPYIYVSSVFVVQKLPWENLLIEFKNRLIIRASEKTMDFIKQFFEREADFGVNCVFTTVMDPLSNLRMKLPARGVGCIHLQCFDAIEFLRMNEQKQTWLCPICQKPVKFENLEIDEYFLNVVHSSNLSEECKYIILLKDGTWIEKTNELRTKVQTVNNEEIIIPSDTD